MSEPAMANSTSLLALYCAFPFTTTGMAIIQNNNNTESNTTSTVKLQSGTLHGPIGNMIFVNAILDGAYRIPNAIVNEKINESAHVDRAKLSKDEN
mmetsp:Transcript_33583/g.58977  ORF Transcript_33583/g.58977 Transcript_33583/m.58977 type:complete len:96 (+) Transcript_33583:495-782(+)